MTWVWPYWTFNGTIYAIEIRAWLKLVSYLYYNDYSKNASLWTNRETPLLSSWVVRKKVSIGQEGVILSKKRKDSLLDSLTLLQQIFPTQESNRGLLHFRQILYQLSYHGSPPRRKDHTTCSTCKTSSCFHHYLY